MLKASVRRGGSVRLSFDDRQTFFIQGTEVEAIRLKSILTQTSRQFERAGVLFSDCAAARLQPLRHWFALSCALPFWHQGNSHLVCNPHLPVSRFADLFQGKATAVGAFGCSRRNTEDTEGRWAKKDRRIADTTSRSEP
jgi:hypothetical protein